MGGSSKNSTSTSQVTIPPEVLAQYQSVNALAQQTAQTPFQQYTGEFVAPVNAQEAAGISGLNAAATQAQPFYTQAAQTLGQADAAAQPYYGAAGSDIGSAQTAGTGLANTSLSTLGNAATAGSGLNNAANQNYGQAYANAQPYNIGATGYAVAGGQAVNADPITGATINQYMSPYLQDVLGSESALLNQNNQQQQMGQLGNAITSGAFGGDRAGIGAANLEQQQNLANANIYSGILNTGYNNALGVAQQQQGVNLGAGQANRAAAQATGASLADIGQQTYAQGTGLASAQQGLGAQEYGQGANTAAQEAALGQQQFGQGITAANTQAGLGQDVFGTGAATSAAQSNLGTAAQTASEQGAQAQLAAGQVQQQTQQAADTAAYNQFLQQQSYPFQVDQFLANIAEGTGALSGSTTTSTQPGSLFSAGGAARGRYAGGGLARAGYAYGGEPGLPGMSPGDLEAILQSQAQMYAPYGQQSGMYGGAGGSAPRGGSSYVPQASLPVSHLTVANTNLPQHETLLQTANDAAKLADNPLVTKGLSAASNWLQGSGGTDPAAVDDPATLEGISDLWNGNARGGAIRRRRAVGGGLGGDMPYTDPGTLDIPNDAPSATLATAGKASGSSGSSTLGDISSLANIGMTAAKVLPMILALKTGGRAERKGFDDGGVADDTPAAAQTINPWDWAHPLVTNAIASALEMTPGLNGMGSTIASTSPGNAVRGNQAVSGLASAANRAASAGPTGDPGITSTDPGNSGLPDSIDAAMGMVQGNRNPIAPFSGNPVRPGQPVVTPDDIIAKAYAQKGAGPTSMQGQAPVSRSMAAPFQAATTAPATPGPMDAAPTSPTDVTPKSLSDYYNGAPPPVPIGPATDTSAAPIGPAGGGLASAATPTPAPGPMSGVMGAIGQGAGAIEGGLHDVLSKVPGLLSDPHTLIPILTGLAAWTGAKTRNPLTALAQGLGAGAQSYGDIQNRLANVAQTQANTGVLNVGAWKATHPAPVPGATFVPGPDPANGNVIVGPDGKPGHWAVGAQFLGAPGPDSSTGAPAGAAVAPSAAPSTPALKYLGPTGQTVAPKEITNYAVAPPQDQAASRAQQNQVQADATSARSQLPQLLQFAQALDVNGRGALQTGPLEPLKAAWVGNFNDVMRTINMPQLQIQSEGLDAATIADKMAIVSAQARAAGADQRSLGALQTLQHSVPNNTMTPQAANDMVMQAIVRNQRDIDHANYYNDFDQASQSNGNVAGNFLSRDADQAFGNDHTADQYQREQTLLMNSLKSGSYQKINAIMQGGDAAKRQALIDALDKTSPNFHRYFTGGE